MRNASILASFVIAFLLTFIGWTSAFAEEGPLASEIKVANAANDFGFRLLHVLSSEKETENVIISPLSLATVLAMTYNGAAGKTKTAMAATLGISSISDDELNAGYKQLFGEIQKADPTIQLEIANALWLQKGLAYDKRFLNINHEFYGAVAESVDFFSHSDEAAKEINTWCDSSTHGKIPDIVSGLSQYTVLVLTDAVYFKGKWTVAFDQKATEPRKFHFPRGETEKIPTMVQTGTYRYLETDEFQAIALPYAAGRFVMYVFLPKPASTTGFFKAFDIAHWTDWISKMANSPGKIVLPKFDLRYEAHLLDALAVLGMGQASGNRADFSRMVSAPNLLISITDVIHKTYMKADEDGTEAAGVSAVIIGHRTVALGGSFQTPKPFEMIVDHSFFCAVADQQTGALLFAGIVNNPSAH